MSGGCVDKGVNACGSRRQRVTYAGLHLAADHEGFEVRAQELGELWVRAIDPVFFRLGLAEGHGAAPGIDATSGSVADDGIDLGSAFGRCDEASEHRWVFEPVALGDAVLLSETVPLALSLGVTLS